MAINLPHPLFLVDVGPCPGAYLSEQAYKDHLKRSGVQHPLEGDEMKIPAPTRGFNPDLDGPPQGDAVFDPSEEIRPLETETCSEEEARQKLEEFFRYYGTAGGANLRVELVRGLSGIRFALVGDWEDMG